MTTIPGVAKDVKGVTPADNLSRILLNHAGGHDRHGVYARNDVTCVLPCKSHLHWAEKGFELKELLSA